VSEMRTEEEQIDAIKNWWKDNGRSTVIGVVIAAAAVFGWKGWQDFERETAEAASVLYQTLVQQSQVQPGQVLSPERRKSASYIANQLKADYDGSNYAQYASLWLAKHAVDQGLLDQARTELEWLLTQDTPKAIGQIARFRLAQIMLVSGQAQEALGQLGEKPESGFEAAYHELRGDLLLALGRADEARAAYMAGVSANDANARPVVAMKLDDLAAQGVN
jgi:predicted negative regulator of RcsB-dependent stress response